MDVLPGDDNNRIIQSPSGHNAGWRVIVVNPENLEENVGDSECAIWKRTAVVDEMYTPS